MNRKLILAVVATCVSLSALAQNSSPKGTESRPQGIPTQLVVQFNPEQMCLWDGRAYSKGAEVNGFVCSIPGSGLGINGQHLGWVKNN